MDKAIYNKESKEALMFPQGKFVFDNITRAQQLGNTPNLVDLNLIKIYYKHQGIQKK